MIVHINAMLPNFETNNRLQFNLIFFLVNQGLVSILHKKRQLKKLALINLY